MKLFRRILTIVAVLLVWGAIIFYLAWASDKSEERRAQARIERINIIIADSPRVDIVTSEMILNLIEYDSLNSVVGRLTAEIDTRDVAARIMVEPVIAQAGSYVDMNNVLYVSVRQRKPVVRVVTGSGYDFYVTEDDFILPSYGYTAQYVPLLTGEFDVPFEKGYTGKLDDTVEERSNVFSEKNYTFFTKLINFVDYIRKDEFWNAQIVQINVCRSINNGAKPTISGATDDPSRFFVEPELELIPRAGNHTIVLGAIEGYEGKLRKLLYFYNNALDKEGWDRWDYIDLRFRGQVVCR